MDQRGRLEGVSGRLSTEMSARHAPQLVIDERNQAVERRGVSLAPGQEQPGHFVHAGVVRHRLVRGKNSVLRFLYQDRGGEQRRHASAATIINEGAL